jgi:hypothetical protein
MFLPAVCRVLASFPHPCQLVIFYIEITPMAVRWEQLLPVTKQCSDYHSVIGLYTYISTVICLEFLHVQVNIDTQIPKNRFIKPPKSCYTLFIVKCTVCLAVHC